MAYTIIFTGKTAQGRREPAVRAELATLFRVDSGRVSRLFSREGAVVKSGLDYAAAQKYVAAIGRAGAICRIEDESAPRPSGTVDVGAVPAQTREGTLPTTDGVEIGLADSAYAPRVCHLVNGSSRGLNLNRNDVQELAFTRIHLAAVVKEVRPMEERCLVVFFCSGERRPYVIDADKIAYADFPGVKGTNLVESLRNLIIYAHEQNPAMRFDDATGKFLAGQKLPLFEKDINRLITALGKSLEAGRRLPTAPIIARPSIPAAEIQRKVAAAEPGGEPVTAAAVTVRTEPEVLTRCPKCSRPLISDEPECAGCGLLFAKWTKRQQKLDETARQVKPDEVSEVPPLETVDAWTERGGRICAGMLLAGFFLPLLKYSMLYGKAKLVLPWHIMGVGMDAEKAAAMATLSGGGNMVVWTLLPLVVGVVGMVACTRLGFHWRVITLLAAGAALLVMLEAVFIREAEILGIMFIAPTVGGGVVSCAAICAGAAVAIANHLRKMFPEHLPARIMSGSGGLVIGALSCLALFAGEDAWKYWTVKIVCVSLMGYGALGVISAVQRDPAPTLLKTISYAARAILVWIPFACLFAQTYGAGAFVDYVISSGGGFVQNLFAMLKCFCLFYGSAFMMAFGGAGLLEEMLIKKGSKS